MESLKINHVAETTAKDADDPVSTADGKIKLLSQIVLILAKRLDADAGVTGTDYVAMIETITGDNYQSVYDGII